MIQIQNTESGAFASISGIDYYSPNINNLRYLGGTNITFATQTISATTTVLPLTAKIGDSGNIGTYTNNIGDVSVQTWRIEDEGNGDASVVFSSILRDQFGDLISTSQTGYLIDQNGNRSAVALESFDANSGITLTLIGNKI